MPHRAHDRVVHLGLWAGIVGPVGFVIAVIVGGLLSPGYSHLGQKISELGGYGAAAPLLQNLAFIGLGMLVIGFAWALARLLGPDARLAAGLVAIFGLSGLIANGLLPCDAGCRGATMTGLLHNITGMIGFLAIVAGMVLLARRWRADPTWRPHAAFTVGCAAVAVGGLAWFIPTQIVDAQELSGLAQRMFIGPLLAWIVVTSIVILGRLSSEGPLRAWQRSSPEMPPA